MLVAERSPPCATSWTCPGPKAIASPADQPPGAEPAAARDPVLLDQAALGHRERSGRAAVVVPVGVLAALPGQQPDIAGVRPVQRQVPAHVDVADHQVGPEFGTRGHRHRDGPELGGGQPAGARRQAVQRVEDRLLALGADAPALLQPGVGPAGLVGAGALGSDSGNRHATSSGFGSSPAPPRRAMLVRPILPPAGPARPALPIRAAQRHAAASAAAHGRPYIRAPQRLL